MMSCTRLYMGHTEIPKKVKQAYNPYKAAMREYEGEQFIIYLYNINR